MESKKDYDIWQPLLFAIVLCLGMFLGYKLSKQSVSTIYSSNATSHLDDLVNLISTKYVDTIDKKILYRSGIEGILKNLDPHTVYIPSSDLKRANEELEGSFYGIGVEFYFLHDTATISAVIPGGPCEKVNIHAGDKIIRIDDSVVAGKKLDDEEIIRRIRGHKNASIVLGLLHLNGNEEKISLLRNHIPFRSVSAFFTLDKQTGFIKIDMFSETTYQEFKTALNELKHAGITKLIIDVRDNPGGYMDAVVEVADELIAGTYTIVKTKGKGKNDSLATHNNGLFESGALCILVNENSASASEILAGAMQDLDRGLVVGRRTYGKGLVQEQFELPGNAAIRITTARYYLPSGRCIQRSYANGKEKYKHDIIDRFSNGELLAQDTTHSQQKIFYTTKHKMVYGEEGIRPDLFVPLDTVYHSELDQFYTEHIPEEFTQQYLYSHKNEFIQFKSVSSFHSNFALDPSILQSLRVFLSQRKLNAKIIDNTVIQNEIEESIRVQFAKLLFGNNGKFRELYSHDLFIQKSIEAMN